MGRICEEFGCVPTVALDELERNPSLVMRIIEYRAYARVFDRCEKAEDESQVPNGPLADLYYRFQKEVMEERVQRRREGDQA